MFEPKTLTPKSDPSLLVVPAPPRRRFENKQNRLMVGALALLLIALGMILYNDRNFWFPDAQDADEMVDQPQVAQPAAAAAVPAPAKQNAMAASTPTATGKATKKAEHSKPQAKHPAPAAGSMAPDMSAPPVTTSARTVLPPLEVEVVAGDTHQTAQPRNNSVRVDMQPPGAPAQAVSDPFAAPAGTTAAATSKAAERVQLSAGTAAVVTRSVRPNYPLLARQMKVQGSVILQALIGRDGLIQDLHVLKGPPILANAAQEAVKQWHFKPHYQGAEAVETLAQITVNFTISTN